MSRSLALFVLAALVLAAPVVAEEHASEAETEFNVSAGLTPTSALYGLAVAWERVQLAFTLDEQRKADRALRQADEKLAEIEELSRRGELEAATRAEERYEELMQLAAESIERLEEAEDAQEAEASLEATSRARANLQLRLEYILDVQERILERQEDNLTEEELERLAQAFERINQAASNADDRLEESRERVKTRAKVLGNLTDEQADELEANVSARAGLTLRLEERAESILAHMQERNERLLNETSNLPSAARERLEVVLDNQLEKLAENFERRNRRLVESIDNRSEELEGNLRARAEARREAAREIGISARERALAERDAYRNRLAERLSMISEEELRERLQDNTTDELEIEVDVYPDYAVVEVELGDREGTFRVRATSREEITREVAERLDISVERVRAAIAFEIEEYDEEELEIEVEVYADHAIAEIELGDEETTLRLNSTNRVEIVSELARQLNLSVGQVRAAIEFDYGDEYADDEDLEIDVDVYADYAVAEIELGDEETSLRLNMTGRTEIVRALAQRLNLSVEEIRAVIEFDFADEYADDDDLEIDVEVYTDYAIAEIEYAGDEQTIRLNVTQRQDIIQALARHTGLSERFVQASTEIDYEDEDDDDESRGRVDIDAQVGINR